MTELSSTCEAIMQTPSEERLVALLDQWSLQWTWRGEPREVPGARGDAAQGVSGHTFHRKSGYELRVVPEVVGYTHVFDGRIVGSDNVPSEQEHMSGTAPWGSMLLEAMLRTCRRLPR